MVISRSSAAFAAAAAIACCAASPAAAAPKRLTFAERLEHRFTAAGGAGSAIAVDLTTGKLIWQHLPDRERIPASVNKLFTTAAFLLALGPNSRISTRAMAAPQATPAGLGDGGSGPVSQPDQTDPAGNLIGNLYLRGGGDPSLGSADVAELAQAVKAAGVKAVPARVIGDDGLFDRIRGVPAWGGTDPFQEGLLSGLAYDHEGSALSAASALTLALRKVGVNVPKGHTGTGTTPLGSTTVARHSSPTVASLIRMTNQPSDNFYAEMLTKALGAIKARSGTTAAGLRVAQDQLSRLGIHPTRVDGSGLSRLNRTSAKTVFVLLKALATSSPFNSSLAVAGRSGTIAGRMRGTAAEGRCRAKTGTLSDVSGLAGLCDASGGGTIAFAMLMNGVNVDSARSSQDAIVSALASWKRPAAG